MSFAGVGEATGKLLAAQEEERELLAEWWAARREHEEATANVAEVCLRRDRAVSRVLGGMTSRQQAWVRSHLDFSQRPRDPAGRQLVLTWLQKREEAEACEAAWASRVAAAEMRLQESDDRLRALAARAIGTWGRAGCSDLTGVPWQRVAALARGYRVSFSPG